MIELIVTFYFWTVWLMHSLDLVLKSFNDAFLWTVRLMLFTFYMDAKMTDSYTFFLMFAYDYEVHCLKQKLAWSDGLETKKNSLF